jgi:hypothetical protein
MLCPIKILGTLRSSAAYRVDQLREMFGCTLLVCALCLIYVIDNGQLEYYGGDSPRQKPDAPFEPGLVFRNDPNEPLSWAASSANRKVVRSREVFSAETA